MLVSRCCKEHVYVESTTEGTAYYICRKCSRATDPVFSLALALEDISQSRYDDLTD